MIASRSNAAPTRRSMAVAAALLLSLSACRDDAAAAGDDGGAATEGSTAGSDGDAGEATGAGEWHEVGAIGPTGLRRLSRGELQRSLEAMFGALPPALFDGIPIEAETPFDNDYTAQAPSSTLVDGLYALADGVATTILADDELRATYLGCTPSGPDDAECLRQLAERLGRSLLRRPLSASELDGYAALIDHGIEEDDFDVAARSVITALVLDGEFLYRIERGTPTPDDPELIALDSYSVATRLSLLLWGTTPDAALLARAQAEDLSDPAVVREVATELLADRRGLEQLQRLHAMWIDYDDLALGSTLEQAMRAETDALVERVLRDRDWRVLFTSDETYMTPELADHYDLGVAVTGDGWIAYPDPRRGGLLSHGSFLSIGAKFGDSSPVERGKQVWTRLLCREIPPPPPSVDTGLPPDGGGANACKSERYDMSRRSECAACHAILDPIGFGLENYGASGEWRTHEIDRPDCAIDGKGAIDGFGSFAGAPSLGELLIDSGEVEACLTRRFVQYAIGREPDTDEESLVESLSTRMLDEHDFVSLVLDFASSEAFTHRRVGP